jgi:acetyl-CoA carboxylase biotin carboxyl carrier protein
MSDRQDNQGLPDLRYIRELAKVFRQFELDELEIENGEQRVLLRRSDFPARPAGSETSGYPVAYANPQPAAAPVGASAPAPAAPATTPGPAETFITSPFVGTFYRGTNPEAPAFVDVGAKVERGQTLCIVEAMKLFNELEAEFPCVIEAVLIDNAQPVEYGTRLFRVRKL